MYKKLHVIKITRCKINKCVAWTSKIYRNFIAKWITKTKRYRTKTILALCVDDEIINQLKPAKFTSIYLVTEMEKINNLEQYDHIYLILNASYNGALIELIKALLVCNKKKPQIKVIFVINQLSPCGMTQPNISFKSLKQEALKQLLADKDDDKLKACFSMMRHMNTINSLNKESESTIYYELVDSKQINTQFKSYISKYLSENKNVFFSTIGWLCLLSLFIISVYSFSLKIKQNHHEASFIKELTNDMSKTNSIKKRRQQLKKLSLFERVDETSFLSTLYHYDGYLSKVNKHFAEDIYPKIFNTLFSEIGKVKHLVTVPRKKAIRALLYLDLLNCLMTHHVDRGLASYVLNYIWFRDGDSYHFPVQLFLSYVNSINAGHAFNEVLNENRVIRSSLMEQYLADFLYIKAKLKALYLEKQSEHHNQLLSLPSKLYSYKGYRKYIKPLLLSEELEHTEKLTVLSLYMNDYIHNWRYLVYTHSDISTLAQLVTKKNLHTALKQVFKAVDRLQYKARSAKFSSMINDDVLMHFLSSKYAPTFQHLTVLETAKQRMKPILDGFKRAASTVEELDKSMLNREAIYSLDGCQTKSFFCVLREQTLTLSAIPQLEEISMVPLTNTWRYALKKVQSNIQHHWQIFINELIEKDFETDYPLTIYNEKTIVYADLRHILIDGGHSFLCIFNQYLKPFIDTHTYRWAPKQWLHYGILLNAQTLLQLKSLYNLANLMNGHKESLVISLKGIPNHLFRQAFVSINGQTFRYQNGPERWQSLHLNIFDDKRPAYIKLLDLHENVFTKRVAGSWQLFRLLSDATLLKTYPNDVFKLMLKIKGKNIILFIRDDAHTGLLKLAVMRWPLLPVDLFTNRFNI